MPYNIAYLLYFLFGEELFHTLAYLYRRIRIVEDSRTHLYSRCTRHHHLDSVLSRCDASHTYNGYLDRIRHLPYHSYCNREHSRTRKSADIVVQDRSSCSYINSHTEQSVYQRNAVCALSLNSLCNFCDIRYIRSQLYDNGLLCSISYRSCNACRHPRR